MERVVLREIDYVDIKEERQEMNGWHELSFVMKIEMKDESRKQNHLLQRTRACSATCYPAGGATYI